MRGCVRDAPVVDVLPGGPRYAVCRTAYAGIASLALGFRATGNPPTLRALAYLLQRVLERGLAADPTARPAGRAGAHWVYGHDHLLLTAVTEPPAILPWATFLARALSRPVLQAEDLSTAVQHGLSAADADGVHRLAETLTQQIQRRALQGDNADQERVTMDVRPNTVGRTLEPSSLALAIGTPGDTTSIVQGLRRLSFSPPAELGDGLPTVRMEQRAEDRLGNVPASTVVVRRCAIGVPGPPVGGGSGAAFTLLTHLVAHRDGLLRRLAGARSIPLLAGGVHEQRGLSSGVWIVHCVTHRQDEEALLALLHAVLDTVVRGDVAPPEWQRAQELTQLAGATLRGDTASRARELCQVLLAGLPLTEVGTEHYTPPSGEQAVVTLGPFLAAAQRVAIAL